MFGRRDPNTGEETPGAKELVRLAIPRRVYTQSHMDYVIEVVSECHRRRETLKAYRFTEQAPFLRHFTGKYAPV
jgi:tyrosine phenol-lyase